MTNAQVHRVWLEHVEEGELTDQRVALRRVLHAIECGLTPVRSDAETLRGVR